MIFRDLQEACISKPVIRIFNSKRLIKIETNALKLAIKVFLTQKYKDKWQSIVYLFRKFLLDKQNYNICDKNRIAIVALLEI